MNNNKKYFIYIYNFLLYNINLLKNNFKLRDKLKSKTCKFDLNFVNQIELIIILLY